MFITTIYYTSPALLTQTPNTPYKKRNAHLKFSLSHIITEPSAAIGRHGVGGLRWSGSELACLLSLVFAVPLVYHVGLVTDLIKSTNWYGICTGI